MDTSSHNCLTTIDPTSFLDFFDALGVFAELNGPRDSLACALSTIQDGHQQRALFKATSEADSESSLELKCPRGHFNETLPIRLGGDNGIRLASIVPFQKEEDLSESMGESYKLQLKTSFISSLHTKGDRRAEHTNDKQPPLKKQKTTTKKKKKPSGQRQREELTFLRSTVAELKNKLFTLKHETRMALCANAGDLPTPAALWLELAQRQQEARERAETENTELRAQVDAQIKFTRTLERAMQKRKLLSSLKGDQQRRCKAIAAEDAEIFKVLRKSVDARTSRLDEIFSAQGLTQDSLGVRNEAKSTTDEENRLRIDIVSCKAALFDVSAMAKVVWGRIALADLSADNCVGLITEVVDDSPDVKLIKQLAVLSSVTGTGSDSGSRSSSECEGEDRVTISRIVCRRIVEAYRVRFVWETQTEARGAVLRGMPPLQLIEKGCGQVFESTVSLDSRKCTMLQSIVSVIPSLPRASSAELYASSYKELSKLIIASFQENAESVRRVIENQLMDQLTVRSSVEHDVGETKGTPIGF